MGNYFERAVWWKASGKGVPHDKREVITVFIFFMLWTMPWVALMLNISALCEKQRDDIDDYQGWKVENNPEISTSRHSVNWNNCTSYCNSLLMQYFITCSEVF